MHIKKKNSIYALIIFFLVISIGLGYSLISTSLSITGGISVAKKRNIYFDNLAVKEGSVTPVTAPTLNSKSAKTDFAITLNNQSDYYEFTLDIVNETSEDVMLKEIVKTGLTEEQSTLIDYIVTYNYDEEIKTKDSLVSNEYDTIKVIIKFKDGLPSIASQTLNLTLKAVYETDDGSSNPRPERLHKMIANKSVMDNAPSQYVTALTGIDFGKAPSTTNGQGIYTRSGTENNEFPIYYYRGNVTDNNVVFGGFCWKIVRTTETGGTKLIYNGKYQETPITEKIATSEYTNIQNDATYPYTFDESTMTWTSTNKDNNSSSSISFSVVTSGYYIIKYKVSSEQNWDKVIFYLDGKELGVYSGENEDLITLGDLTSENIITAKYSKDASISNGSDSVTFSLEIKTGVSQGANCNNTGYASQLENTSEFNLDSYSPADIGYMYGTRYSAISHSFTKKMLTNWSIPSTSNYYYSESVIYENGNYVLQNAEQKTWSENYQNLVGYYTCRNNSTFCSSIYYIVGISSNTGIPSVTLEKGQTIDDLNIVLSKTIVDNNDGTYTLETPETISRSKWYTEYKNYKDYYVCDDLISTTCAKMLKIVSSSTNNFSYSGGDKIVYGNDVSWDGEKYTLIDTYVSNNWSEDHKTVATKFHYTCLNADGICKAVYYISEFYFDSMYYLTLKDGKNIEDAKTEMLTNTNDSAIKTAVDSWYGNNLNSYTTKLEDTIWCNDRSIAYGPLKSKDEDSSNKSYTYFGAYARNQETKIPSVTCPNKNDSFTLSTDSGGTEGYGNNALKYPIGLLTADELTMAGNGSYGYSTKTYLYIGKNWWSISPRYINYNVHNFYLQGQQNNSTYITSKQGVRPSISLKNSVKIYNGTGTVDNPYIIK